MALILSQDQIEGHGVTRTHWLYNALDCALTREVADALIPVLDGDEDARLIYEFSHALQAPALTMTLRGVAIDPVAREAAIAALEADEKADTLTLAEVAAPFWASRERRAGKCADGKPHRWPRGVASASATCGKCGCPRLVAKALNPHSVPQMMKLLYGGLGLPEQRNHKTHKASVDDECLDALKRKEPACIPVVNAILGARRSRKQLGLLRARLDSDGRWRSSFNVGAAVTGRWSSSKSPFWSGGNLQNIADRSRNIFVADPGLVLFYADYEQAESRVVAFDAQDEAYIEAHATGDVHTTVTRMVWPEARPWTGDLKLDRKLADEPAPFDEFHELRWYAKHVAHGSAIGMTPIGIARDAHVPVAQAEKAQGAYFGAFPRVRARQNEIMAQVRDTGQLTTPLRRRRQFMGRLHDPATMREALAQTQQSMIVDWVSIALWRIWYELDDELTLGTVPNPGDPNRCWLLGQIHDAVLGEVRLGDDETLARIVELMSFGMTIHGRYLTIPCEVKVGRHWRKDGMRKWAPGFDWASL